MLRKSLLESKISLDLTKPILLTFDAFGTLYSPIEPIAEIYTKYAKLHGAKDLQWRKLEGPFRKAYKKQCEKYPNFGAESKNVTPKLWWHQVILETFNLFPEFYQPPDRLSDQLWQVFNSRKGYRLEKTAVSLFETLQALKKGNGTGKVPIKVGVITNSDPRVPTILADLGLRVRPLRCGIDQDVTKLPILKRSEDTDVDDRVDIDFVVMSYDVKYQKPATRMFRSALALNEYRSHDVRTRKLQCIHVGDNEIEDFQGALNCGWQSILFDKDRKPQSSDPNGKAVIYGFEDLTQFLRSKAGLP